MTLTGHIQNGVVVFDDGGTLPEGTRVAVTQIPSPAVPSEREKRRVEFPLIRTGTPGSVHLTNDRIAEILEEEEIAAREEDCMRVCTGASQGEAVDRSYRRAGRR